MKMPGENAQLRGRCRTSEVQLVSKIPGSLIPAWAKGRAEHALTLDRLTPARYRYSAAVADNTDHATPNMVLCPQIGPAGLHRAIFASIHRRPIVCREVHSHQGKSVHLSPHHSPRTCRIRPECACLLVQSTASLQRFAYGSDATNFSQSSGISSCPPRRTTVTIQMSGLPS
jgi:hypothetical protein